MKQGYVLRIDSSANENSISRRLGDLIIERIARPGVTLVRRDLAAAPAPFIDMTFAADMHRYQTEADARAVASLAVSEQLISELEVASIVVLCTPMHNFSVPAVLKCWIDQVVRIGRTFRSTPVGKIGLLNDRPALVAISTGGPVSHPNNRQPDFLRPYIAAIFATIGIQDVTFYSAEGTARDREGAWSRACDQLRACPRLQALSGGP